MEPNTKAHQLLNHIGNELKLLWWQMDTWHELFAVEQERRRALIQATAPGFFAIAQATLAESILMRIARLMDPPGTARKKNVTVSSLGGMLQGDAHSCLREAIETLTAEWNKTNPANKAEQGEYASLKFLRNKWLAHNDSSQRQDQSKDSLWIPLTHKDFAVVQRLAGQLWTIYRQAHLTLKDADVLEPQHSCSDNRSSMVFKHLCASQYLDQVIKAMSDEWKCKHIAELNFFEQQHMGEDKIRKVFTTDQAAEPFFAAGDCK